MWDFFSLVFFGFRVLKRALKCGAPCSGTVDTRELARDHDRNPQGQEGKDEDGWELRRARRERSSHACLWIEPNASDHQA